MKGLSFTQPYAQLVVTKQKRFETRSWGTEYRGPVAVHASKGFPRWAREMCYEEPFLEALGPYWAETAPLGAIVGVAQLNRIYTTQETRRLHPLHTHELEFGDWTDGRYAWRFTDPVKLLDPIPVRGMLGLWTLPPEVEAELNEQLAAGHA